ncbi:MAG: carbohydrate ABC transporter permease, partial [Clostridia bacterium]|nr:carbohydrate ABC transporter permease [Clostridia bacterium]
LMMIPGVLTLVPQFLLYRRLNLNDKLIAVLLPQLTMQPVGAVFLLSMFFKALPKDLFNAAEIDGASEFQIFINIAVPLCVPILITQAIMQINGLWNDYLWPMTVISTNYSKLTVSAGLIVEFRNMYSQNMPVTYSVYLIASIPLLFVFLFGNRFYIQGLIASSIKM